MRHVVRPRDVNSLRRAAWPAARAGLVTAVVLSALTGCDADRTSDPPAGEPTAAGSAAPVVRPHRPAMPDVPLRFMYARGGASEGVLVSAGGITRTGRPASAYVPTRTGAIFASGGRVLDLADEGTPVVIGSVPEHSVLLQVDPTLRYVAWAAGRAADGRHARVLVYDVVTHRRVLDRVLPWSDRTGPLRITRFGAARLRLVHLPRWGFWTFATVSGHTLTTPGGQVVDLRTRRVEGPRVSRDLRSPGLRYRVSEPKGRRPWRVVDLRTGRDVTPAALLGHAARPARLTGWLGDSTFGVLTTSGSWRHSSVTASVCRVAGRCRVVWRHRLGAEDSGLQQSNEIG